MKIVLTALTLMSASTLLCAQNTPVAFASDARIRHVSYQDNNVVPIAGRTLTTTQIVFSSTEKVLDIEGGDSAAWMVTYHPELSNVVFVKPTLLGSESNLTILTNQHAYYFHLTSNKTLHTKDVAPTYALKFDYPNTQVNRNSSHATPAKQTYPVKVAPKHVNTAYRFSGSPQLLPLHVFDDGAFTYFELGANSPAVAIFAVDDNSGKESTVNIRRQGKYLVVQRTAPQFTLRLGKMSTSVFNTAEINRIQQNRRPS